METKTFKENWRKEDILCPSCKQVTQRVKGLTRQNLKRLITPKLNMTEIIITFMIIMSIVLGYAYQSETKICKDWINEMFNAENVSSCKNVCDYKCDILSGSVEPNQTQEYPKFNASIFNITLKE